MNEAPPEQESVAEARARRKARSEAKDQAVRDSLEPLEPGERPLAVTVAVFYAVVLILGNLLTLLLYEMSDRTASDDESKAIFQTVAIIAILAVAAGGMWRAKYWAVLGFETLLALQVLIFSLLLLKVSNVFVAILFLAIVLWSSVLFWFLIRAMARIQMPESPDVKSLQEQRAEAEKAAQEEESERSDG